jgi:uncharacterized membrane protein
MRTMTIAYVTVLVVLTAIDFVWLRFVALAFYKAEVGPLLLEKPQLAAALLFYVLSAVGIVMLAVQPALAAGSWQKAVWLGAVFGLCAYGTYDLTNLATLKGWSLRLTLVDMAWGTVLVAVTALAGFMAARAGG